jgi:hypothetical protein
MQQQQQAHDQLPATTTGAPAPVPVAFVVARTPQHALAGSECRSSRDGIAVRSSQVWQNGLHQQAQSRPVPAGDNCYGTAAVSQTATHAVLSRQLQLPLAAVAEQHGSSSAATASAAQAAIAEATDDCRRSFCSRSSRPASASAQLLRQSLGAFESTAGSAAAVKALAAQAEGLATALAAAARDAADAK